MWRLLCIAQHRVHTTATRKQTSATLKTRMLHGRSKFSHLGKKLILFAGNMEVVTCQAPRSALI